MEIPRKKHWAKFGA